MRHPSAQLACIAEAVAAAVLVVLPATDNRRLGLAARLQLLLLLCVRQ